MEELSLYWPSKFFYLFWQWMPMGEKCWGTRTENKKNPTHNQDHMREVRERYIPSKIELAEVVDDEVDEDQVDPRN